MIENIIVYILYIPLIIVQILYIIIQSIYGIFITLLCWGTPLREANHTFIKTKTLDIRERILFK